MIELDPSRIAKFKSKVMIFLRRSDPRNNKNLDIALRAQFAMLTEQKRPHPQEQNYFCHHKHLHQKNLLDVIAISSLHVLRNKRKGLQQWPLVAMVGKNCQPLSI
jgi:hypothetical protein